MEQFTLLLECDGSGSWRVSKKHIQKTALQVSNCSWQVDHFEGCHALDEKAEKIEGAPNFRQV